MIHRGQRRRGTAVVAVLVAALTVTAGAAAQYGGGDYPGGGGGYGPGGGGYGPGGGPGDGGKLRFELKAKKKQRSLKAVKVKATCENRPCSVNAKGKLRADGDKARLKRDKETLAAGDTDKLKLKLPKRARRTAKSALRDDEKLKVKVTGKAKGVGGGGRAKDSVKIKLKR